MKSRHRTNSANPAVGRYPASGAAAGSGIGNGSILASPANCRTVDTGSGP